MIVLLQDLEGEEFAVVLPRSCEPEATAYEEGQFTWAHLETERTEPRKLNIVVTKSARS